MVSFSLEGLSDVLASVRSYDGQTRSRVQNTVARYAYKIAREAKGLAPVDSTLLRGSIRAEIGSFAADVVADAPHAPYVEFGTGSEVSVPPGLEDYAREFYVDGSGHTPAQPFLFPAVEANRAPFRRDLEEAVDPSRVGVE